MSEKKFNICYQNAVSAADAYARPVALGGTIDLWVLSPICESPFLGEPGLLADPQNYRFVNGFVGVGDLPCRKAFRATVIGRDVAFDDGWPISHLRLPGAGSRIDFSEFWYRPTHLSRWAGTILDTPKATEAAFHLTTNGGVRLFVNGIEAARFEPFRRNRSESVDIRLPLKAGHNQIVVFTEDLAERDTDWFFELIRLDDVPIIARLPIDVAAPEIETVQHLAASLRPEFGLNIDRPFALIFDKTADRDVPVRIAIGNHVHERHVVLDRQLRLAAGEQRLEVCPAGTITDGMYRVVVQFEVGGAVVEKVIEGAFLSSLTPRPPLSGLAERKAEASRWFAAHGELLVGRALAMLHSGEVDLPVLRTILERSLDFIVHREDCSDFWMVPLLWIWRDYRDRLPEDLRQAVKTAILGYRYWVDEPGNDAMWFWSENHVLCFHVAQHVAGRLFPDEIFANSCRSGRDQEREGAEKLARWFDSIEREGLAEWNSSAYYPIDFIGLLGLQHMADAPLKTRAVGMLDRICQMVALHTTAGVPGGSQGRAYNKELLGGPLTELVSIVRIAFGTGWLNHGVTAPPMLAASDYRPPASAMAFADPGEEHSLEARYTQGLDHTAKLVVYRTRDAQLSSVVDHHTGRHGHQQHVVDVQLSGHPLARLFVNHPGEEDPSGSHRPSFWAGNGVLPRVGQLLDVSMLLFDLGDDRIGWTHGYFGREGMDEIERLGDWLLVRSGKGAAAMFAANGLRPIDSGPTTGHEVRSDGRRNGWIVAIGKSFAELKARIAMADVAFDAETLRLDLSLPDRPRLALSYVDGLSLGGKPKPFSHLTPAPTLTFHSARPEISSLSPFLSA
ncbi:hypothetical protein [Pleomorphomonas oryzae]|uniref:hypothetical protein n=1 Tax=Pleomorphomonas oryzae TaxID=261934 RepID=UPI00042399F7|nr:hypothetical protein [Pleomorphomonas oryzae]